MLCGPDGELPEKLRNLEPRLIEHISNEIMVRDPNVRWDDIGKFRGFKIHLMFQFDGNLICSVRFLFTLIS
jgi:SpoVK/Ycf46/Vps4 family AAA+-type ATPase